MQHPVALAVELEKRGVYLAPKLSRHGLPYWYAIDSQGREIARIQVTGVRTEYQIRRRLWEHLNEVDPLPRLTLVKPEAPAPEPRRPTREELELAAIYDDPVRRMLYQRKKAASLGALPKIPFFRD